MVYESENTVRGQQIRSHRDAHKGWNTMAEQNSTSSCQNSTARNNE